MASSFKNSIENIFNKMTIFSILSAIVTIAVGVILLVAPEQTDKMIGMAVGVIFLLSGLNSIYKYLKRDGAKIYSLSLVFGVLYALLGLLLLVYPFTVTEFVTVCLGLYILINGANKVNNGLWLKKGSEDSWLITIATGILLIVIGVLIIFNPFANLTLTKICGIFLIISGILDFTDSVMFKLRSKEIIEIFW